ncbi:MAG: DUF4394 domain-containing protein [Rariglobus sp.]
MSNKSLFAPKLALAASLLIGSASLSHAQSAYGVDGDGQLFSVDLAKPEAVTPVAKLNFKPVGIDFLPGSKTLYALGVDDSKAQLYTIDTQSGAATAVGAGFPLKGEKYDLTGAKAYGFDFNPTTLQADGSIRIRLTASNGTNLRLHSVTGGVAATDGAIKGSIGAVAYTNSANAITPKDGKTELFDIDTDENTLSLQNPPNDGVLVPVGSLGVKVGHDAAFDIHTSAAGVNTAYLVNPTGKKSSDLYIVDLKTGAAQKAGKIKAGFKGGFAIVP